ncbi:MAG: type toxin-antitoxin system death-on-curing family toxin [Marmoricola sp.]|nr:type toxin-antitoxin system death-on-curing family toxin [Marmoricola sp.]
MDGHKRRALVSLIAFLGVNGLRLTLSNASAFDLIMGIADGELDDVGSIATIVTASVGPHRF